jgi:hypothetical protein
MGWQIINQDSDNINILALPTEDAVAPLVDQVPFYDASAGGNRKTAVTNLFPAGSITGDKLVNGALSADTLGRAKMADQFLTFAKLASSVFPITSAVSSSFQTVAASTDVAVSALSLSVTKPLPTARVVLFGWVSGAGSRATLSLQADNVDLISPVNADGRTPGMFGFGNYTNDNNHGTIPIFGVHTASGNSFTYRVFCRVGVGGFAEINGPVSKNTDTSSQKTVSVLYALVLP